MVWIVIEALIKLKKIIIIIIIQIIQPIEKERWKRKEIE